jgi:hypothetical protein
MLVTAHVAAVSYVVRLLVTPSTLVGSLIWVPLTISLAVFLSWPIGQAVASAFDPGDARTERTCPNCGRRELRPLIRPGAGLFQPVTAYRCDASGIDFLADLPIEGDIRFLDEG